MVVATVIPHDFAGLGVNTVGSTTGDKKRNVPAESIQQTSQPGSANKRRPRKKRKNPAKESNVELHERSTESKNRNLDNNNHRFALKSSLPTVTGQKTDRSGRPSRTAMELSAKLKECSINKRLKEALDLYWDKSNNSIRDSHHACIMVDCSARCGAIHEGEKIVQNLIHVGLPVTIETNTALLKGYAHAGMMEKGASLFQQMCREKGRHRPNVRTLNTLLRGCLWTAACVRGIGTDGEPIVAGGIITAREAWLRYGESETQKGASYDSSSYEYYIALLCYSLHVEEAEAKIIEFKQQYSISSKLKRGDVVGFTCDDPGSLETLTIALLSLARAYGVLGEFKKATATSQLVLLAADSVPSTYDKKQDHQLPHRIVNGGKRAWRNDDIGSRRSESNTLFRSHRINEIRSEAKWIIEVCSKRDNERGIFTKSIATRLCYFSGGGTTGLIDSGSNVEKMRQTQVLNSSWLSFGLKESTNAASKLPDLELSKLSVLNDTSCKALLGVLQLGNNPILDKRGLIHFPVVFKDALHKDQKGVQARRKLNVELGSGSGDWIAKQAKLNPHDNFVSVELRSDRVAQTFAKAVLSNPELKNLSCVGAEAGSFLRQRLRPASISTIFVNHPEPPTQMFGSQDAVLESIADGTGEEPAHMLSSNTLQSAFECLEVEGRLVIVTDNRFYARLICATMIRVLSTSPTGLFESVSLKGFTEVERFGSVDRIVHLYEGSPSLEINHASDANSGDGGSSYFDRLWRTGASNHAEKRKRFVVVVARKQDSSAADKSQVVKKGKKRKFRVRGEQI